MVVDPTLARVASRASQSAWLSAGRQFETALKDLTQRALAALCARRPPMKVARLAADAVEAALAVSGLPGSVTSGSGRHHSWEVCLPEPSEGSVSFVHLTGSINGRTGALDQQRRTMLTASLHVLERLHQRMGTRDSAAVLREVQSGLVASGVLAEAAIATSACHWPLVTPHGLFVCGPSPQGTGSLLITWMRFDQLGVRWGRVADDLRAARSSERALLDDPEFCAELLRLHGWLLKPHTPGRDVVSQWWERRPLHEQEAELRDLEATVNNERPAHDMGSDPDGAETLKDEASPGEDHQVRPRQRFTGIVVQVRTSGTRVIALRNGCFGLVIPRRTTEELVAVAAPGELAPRLGDRVDVEVERVIGPKYLGPHSVLLQPSALIDAAWAQAQARYEVGATFHGVVVWTGETGALIVADDGTTGWLADEDRGDALACATGRSRLEIGRRLDLHVVGHALQMRRLRLSATKAPSAPMAWQPGQLVDGVVVWSGDSGAVIRLPDGASGWLPKAELSWFRKGGPRPETPPLGDALRLRVKGFDSKRDKVRLSLREVDGHPIDHTNESDLIGMECLVTVSNVVQFGVFVAMPGGYDGLLHVSELPSGWLPAPGEQVRVRVASLDRDRRRVALALCGDASALQV